MALTRSGSGWVWWLLGGVVVAAGLGGAGVAFTRGKSLEARAREEAARAPETRHVEVVRLRQGDLDRVTVLTGSVLSYEAVQLYARVPGFLETQTVDIGDRVTDQQVLVTVAVPELKKQVQRHKAAVDEATTRVDQELARVDSARADLKAVQANQRQAEANAKAAAATLRFRERQLQRMKDLFADKSVDERLVDEALERRDAAAESERAAQAAIDTAKAQAVAAEAKVRQALADVAQTRALVAVAVAEKEKAEEMVKFATIRAPFAGVITQRSLFIKDYVRSADAGASAPLLTVERTDKVRVIIQVPDTHVPYADVGDAAVVELDALPGRKFPAKITRVAKSEDVQTRLMRAEIDLDNPDGQIRQGMYGRVTLVLDRSPLLSLPKTCLVGKAKGGKGAVFVVRDGHARLTPVELGADNTLHVAVLKGIIPTDDVILQPPAGMADGVAVTVANPAPVRESEDNRPMFRETGG